MSYCRWSSDDFQCDVYVYESLAGFETHVAAARHVLTKPLPDPVPIPRGPRARNESAWDEWFARNEQVHAILAATVLAPIGLQHDGESFTHATAAECAENLEALRVAGYVVPQYAIDALRWDDHEAAE
jgi:hypothetical protein